MSKRRFVAPVALLLSPCVAKCYSQTITSYNLDCDTANTNTIPNQMTGDFPSRRKSVSTCRRIPGDTPQTMADSGPSA
jgi:hypothetical protein